jgi:hypothetical protein
MRIRKMLKWPCPALMVIIVSVGGDEKNHGNPVTIASYRL